MIDPPDQTPRSPRRQPQKPTSTATGTHFVYCDCAGYNLVDPAVHNFTMAALEASGASFSRVPDLCRICVERDIILKNWKNSEKLVVIACFPRAVKWLLKMADFDFPATNLEVYNLREKAEFKQVLSRLSSPDIITPKNYPRPHPDGWIPWFPVIDYKLCVNCEKCLNFCLFEVYARTTEGQVEVRNPAACKTNCPACARLCPHHAIIFPKHGEPPINGDEPEPTADVLREANPLDYSQLGIVELHNRLRNRTRNGRRFKPGPGSEPANRQTDEDE